MKGGTRHDIDPDVVAEERLQYHGVQDGIVDALTQNSFGVSSVLVEPELVPMLNGNTFDANSVVQLAGGTIATAVTWPKLTNVLRYELSQGIFDITAGGVLTLDSGVTVTGVNSGFRVNAYGQLFAITTAGSPATTLGVSVGVAANGRITSVGNRFDGQLRLSSGAVVDVLAGNSFGVDSTAVAPELVPLLDGNGNTFDANSVVRVFDGTIATAVTWVKMANVLRYETFYTNGNIQVNAGGVLTIDSGVTVTGSSAQLSVNANGQLRARTTGSLVTTFGLTVTVNANGRITSEQNRYSGQLQLASGAVVDALTGNRFGPNSTAVAPELVPVLNGNTFDANSVVRLFGGTITTAVTWLKFANVLRYETLYPAAPIRVNAGGVLTIDSGVNLKSIRGSVEVTSNGGLFATNFNLDGISIRVTAVTASSTITGVLALTDAAVVAEGGAQVTLGISRLDSWGDSSLLAQGAGSSLAMASSAGINVASGTLTTTAVPLTTSGVITVDGGNLNVQNGNIDLQSLGALRITPGRQLTVTGNLGGTTANADLFTPAGAVTFSGGTLAAPRTLEVMGRDLGATANGFRRNFDFGTLRLANSTVVRLVDLADNSPSVPPDSPTPTAEAVYVETLTVPAGSTLDLNGLKLYVRVAQIDGTIIGGSVVAIPDAGPIVLNESSSGRISNPGEIDEWAFYGTSGKAVRVVLTTSGATLADPKLNWGRVQLLGPTGTVLATVTATSSGQQLVLPTVPLTETGVYKVRVSAPTAAPNNNAIGTYSLIAWDATPFVRTLQVNELTTSALITPYSQHQWTFAAATGTQIQLDLPAGTNTAVGFSLSGPEAYVGFTDITADSSLLTLPTAGTYTLTVRSGTGAVSNYSFTMRQTQVTDATLGVPVTGTLAGKGDARLFRITLPDAQILALDFTGANAANRVEMYAQFGTAPTRETHTYRYSSPGASQNILIPSASPGTWYVLVYGDHVPAASGFTFVARGSSARISSVLPEQAGNALPLYATINGAGFARGTTVELVGPGNAVVAPTSMSLDGYSRITATFPAGLPVGDYAVRVVNGSNSDMKPAAIRVTAGGRANLETHLVLPGVLGRLALATLYVEYANTGDLAMPAPLLMLGSADPDGSDRPVLSLDQSRLVENFFSFGLPEGTGNSVMLLASGAQPGVLNPGERIRVPVYFHGLERPWNTTDNEAELELRFWLETDTQAMDWASARDQLRPSTLSSEAWSAVYENLTSGIATTGDYVRMLNSNARYLAGLGENVSDVDAIWNFEVQQAYGFSASPTLDSVVDIGMTVPGTPLQVSRSFSTAIYSRYQMGPFGRGWSAPWQATLTRFTDPGTNIANAMVRIVGLDGATRTFQLDRRRGRGYISSAGDSARLVEVSPNVFELQTVGGAITRFSADGKLDFASDLNGNRVTAAYDGAGRLASLTHRSGAAITFSYRPSGRIASIADSAGRTTAYTYDATDSYLQTVTAPDGRMTRYTYETGSTPQLRHVLVAIERGGTTQHFTYDARGRLNSSYLSGNAGLVNYAYDDAGMVSVDTDPLIPGTTRLYFDQNGQVSKITDPLGFITDYDYDEDFRLSRTVAPTGESQSFTWCACGSLTSQTNELGQTTSFTYDTLPGGLVKRMSSYSDAKGNTTRYTYDDNGNLRDTIYANGSVERLSSYTTSGQPGVSTNRRGQALSYQYNVAGQVTRQTFADGSFITFAYDARGNLTTITEGAEVTTYTYDFAVDGDRLRRVTYPDGRWLNYSYDAFGRRTAMVDQDGFATRYEYDAAGRLYRLRDAGNVLLITYLYDGAGRLSRIDKGNGTFTTYEYDAAGQVLSLKNWRNSTTLNSKFDYTYDSRGRRVSMVTLDGTWTYGYDGSGQLVRAVFASLNEAVVPSQDLLYEYDAAGNRTRTVINGTTTIYVTNNLNQYTSVGGVPYAYDTDGNLLGDGDNTYVYDQLSRPVRVQGAETTQFAYRPLGEIRAVTLNGNVTQYLSDPTRLNGVAAKFLPNGERIGFVFGLSVESSITGFQPYLFNEYDIAGSLVSTTSDNGHSSGTVRYRPFADVVSAAAGYGTPFAKHGVESGNGDVVRTGYRLYDPSLGRFLSIDPIRLSGGDANINSYAGNNPISLVDPFGTIAYPTGFSLPSGFLDKVVDATGLPSAFLSGDCKAIVSEAINIVAGHIGESAGERLGRFIGARVGLIGGRVVGTLLGGPIFGYFVGREAYFVGRSIGGFIGGVAGELAAEMLDKETSFASRGASRVCGLLAPLIDPIKMPGGHHGGAGSSPVINSIDPNDKHAESSFGPLGFVRAGTDIPYRINFENYSTATAPAQTVTIFDQLSSDFDWTTFRVTGAGFGDNHIVAPSGSQSFQTTRSMTYNGQTFSVVISVGINLSTGIVSAEFHSVDPTTELPPDVLSGFLPPEDGTGRGLGYVTFTVKPRAGLATGTEIRNVAVITFDYQLAIATDQVDPLDASKGIDTNKQARITIDAGRPSAVLNALPAETATTAINLTWTGSDDAGGSGIGRYTVYVSVNGGAWFPGLVGVQGTSAVYQAQAGRSYRFAVVATDNTGWGEDEVLSAEATTTTPDPAVAPTDLSLSSTTILENSAAPTVLGNLATIDGDVADTFTYQLVAGEGDSGNALFEIIGNVLRARAPFDFEAGSTWSIRVRTTDSAGLTFEKALSITIVNVNETPTAINLSNATISENVPVGTPIGTFTTTDPDAGNTFAYSLVAGPGSTDNALFTIVGNQLRSNAGFDLETKTSYSIRVRTTDQGNLSFEQTITINVTNANETPTSVVLSANAISESMATGTSIGNFATTDPDAGNTFTYTLVGGFGSTDNSSFSITGSALRSSAVFDFEARSTYTIRVRATDQGGLSIEQTFTINVTNVNEAPTLDNTGNVFTVLGAGSRQSAEMRQGTIVSDLLARGANGNPISDPDAGALRGIALTAVDQSLGNFQYTLVTNNPAETDWVHVDAAGAVSDASALLLPTTARIRFNTSRIPHHASAPPFLTLESKLDAGISFRAWDQTSGVAGGRGNASSNGGATAFSQATETSKVYFEVRLFRHFNANASLNVYTLEAEFNALAVANNPAFEDRSTDAWSGFTVLLSNVPELATTPMYRMYYGVQFNANGTQIDMGYRYLTTNLLEAQGLENSGPADKRPQRAGAYFREQGVNNGTGILGYIYTTQQTGTQQMRQIYRTDVVQKPTRPPGTSEGGTPTSFTPQENGDHVYTTNTTFEMTKTGTWRVEDPRGFVRPLGGSGIIAPATPAGASATPLTRAASIIDVSPATATDLLNTGVTSTTFSAILPTSIAASSTASNPDHVSTTLDVGLIAPPAAPHLPVVDDTPDDRPESVASPVLLSGDDDTLPTANDDLFTSLGSATSDLCPW